MAGETEELPGRPEGVPRAIYLIFNEGYSLTRPDLSGEAIRPRRPLIALLPVPVR